MPRRYSMTNRGPESEATKRQILDAVVEVVAERGLDGVTVQAVAAHADVAVRTVYNHFATREELVAAALGTLAEETRAATQSIEVGEQPTRDKVLAFVDSYARSYEAQGSAVRALMSAVSVPRVSDVVRDVRAWRRQQLRTLLRHAQSEGVLRLPLAEAVTVAYLATAYATYASLVDDAGVAPQAARATLRTMVDRSLFGAAEPGAHPSG
jgi:AcrR family transcriptional regulator